MAKFGTILDKKVPVILCFYSFMSQMDLDLMPSMRECKVMYGPDIDIQKLDYEKNKKVCDALRVRSFPTIIVYYLGEMKSRFLFENKESFNKNIQEIMELVEQ